MTVLLLASLLLANNVVLNFGAPADNHEATVDSVAPADNHETTVDSVAPADNHETTVDSVAPADNLETTVDSVAPVDNHEVILDSGAPVDGYKMSLEEAHPNILQRQRAFNQNSNGYNTWRVTTTKDGQCVQEFSIKGKGVDDTFSFPCSVTDMASHVSSEDVLVAGKDTVQINSIYGKQPGQLQVIQEGECSVRTYTTSNGKTTASSSPVAGAECDAIKKEHQERMQKWQRWEAKTFPACFPFCNTANPGATAPLPSKPSGAVPQYDSPWNASPFDANSDSSSYVPPGNLVPNQSFDQLLAALMQMMNRY